MNQDLAKQFLTITYTKNQALRRLRIVKELLDLLFFENSNPDDFENTFNKLKAKYSAHFVGQEGLEDDIKFIESLGANFFKTFSAINVNDQIKRLEESVTVTKNIIIYLPFELPEKEIASLGNWFKQNLGQTSLFEVNYDPELIGGCAISYKGIFKDYSLRAKLKENKGRILQELGGYKAR